MSPSDPTMLLYKRMARRYAEAIGPPPLLPRTREERVAVCQQMLAALNGRRPTAPIVRVGAVSLTVPETGMARAIVDGLAADGRVVATWEGPVREPAGWLGDTLEGFRLAARTAAGAAWGVPEEDAGCDDDATS